MECEFIVCVECGTTFNPEEADYVSYSTASVQCPECGRLNFCKSVELEGFEVEDLEVDPDITDETDEIYIEGYLSNDLVLDSANKNKKSQFKKIGVAKRKRVVPKMPMFEYRKAIARSLPLDINSSKYRTKTEEEEFMEDEFTEEDAEQ